MLSAGLNEFLKMGWGVYAAEMTEKLMMLVGEPVGGGEYCNVLLEDSLRDVLLFRFFLMHDCLTLAYTVHHFMGWCLICKLNCTCVRLLYYVCVIV